MPDDILPNDNSRHDGPPFQREKLLTLAQAARHIPPLRNRKGKANTVHPSTLYRWGTQGRRSRSGKLVRLELWRVGGTICTSVEALERFFRALNDEDDGPDKHDDDGYSAIGVRPRSPPRSPGSRAKENVNLQNQSQEAMQILALRGYVD